MVSTKHLRPYPEEDVNDTFSDPPVYTPLEEGQSAVDPGDELPNSTPLLTSKDIVIGVMGVTGVGKSTFISYFSKTAKIGIGLQSCTKFVSIHEARIGDQKCFLIDTPGFDDTNRSDTDVLREIADWLNRSYKASIQLAGIVYLQRISDPRVGGASLKNLRMFKKLCGSEGLSCVVLATTMWSQVPPELGERREEELISKKEFWGEMINKGSQVMRLRPDEEEISAIEIVRYILEKRQYMTTALQKEMASGKTLDETSAGRELEAELEKLKKKNEEEMRALRKEFMEAQIANDKKQQEELAAIRADLQKKMDQDKEDRERMRVTMEELQKQRDEELRQEREKNHETELKLQGTMAESEQRIKMMKLESDHEIEMTKLRFAKENVDAEIARYRIAEEERKRKEEDNGGGCFVM